MSTQIILERDIAADPASVALLLAGPTAAELWPGVHAVEGAGGPMRVSIDVPGRGALTAVVLTSAPVRTPTAFRFRFTVSSPALPELGGRLLIDPRCGPVATPCARLRLQLDYAGEHAEGLCALAEAFVDNLRIAAEQRSRAA